MVAWNQEAAMKIVSFITGLGVGVAVAVLFAPRSGEETREKILGTAEEGRRYARKRVRDLQAAATGAIDRGRDMLDRSSEVLDRGKEILDRGKDILDRGKDAIENGQDTIERHKRAAAAAVQSAAETYKTESNS
jgi:gas vesicle protein